jgi:FkbM family methyltransferase
MSALKNLAKRAYFRVRRDPANGHLYYMADGKRLYVRSPRECVREEHRRYIFQSVIFPHYMPRGHDCVIDFGAGNGTEIIPMAIREPDLNYIAVEIQPWVYECLCLTLSQFGSNYRPYALAVGDEPVVAIDSTLAGTDASILGQGVVPVEGIRWEDFVRRHNITTVDLLKVNIEGAEAALLEHIDLSIVRRVVVSVHDFRADRGDGEQFRTRDRVFKRLSDAGFIHHPHPEMPEAWMRSWSSWARPES